MGWLRLLDVSRRAERSSPVFIVGEARGGSTLLFRTLLKHPAFAPREENLQETSFAIQAPRAADFFDAPPRNLHRFLLGDDDEWEAFLSTIRPLRPWLRLHRRVARRRPEAAAPGRERGASALVARSFVFHAQRARGCRRLVEKTPEHVHHVERLLSWFPEARILYIHRHPVDVYSSYVRRGQVDPKAEWARIGVDAFCEKFRVHVRVALDAAARRPYAVLVLRYRALTLAPEDTFRRICAFLDEPFVPDAVREPDDPGPRRWAHWEQSSHLYEGMKARTKDWRDYLSAEDADRLQRRLQPELGLLGYLPYDVGGERGREPEPALT